MSVDYEDKEFTVVYPNYPDGPLTLTSLQKINNIGIQLDKDADFFWCGIQLNFTGQPLSVQFFDYTNFALSSDLMGAFPLQAANTGVGVPYTFQGPLFFPAGSAIIMNIRNDAATTNGPMQFLFRGIKRFYRNGVNQ